MRRVGLVAALDSDLDFSILNFGAGRQVSLLEVVAALERELGVSAILDHQPVQTGDVRRTWADITAARETLGYFPQVSFDEGVRRVRTKDGWASVLSAKGTPLLQRCPAPGTEAPLPRCATPDGIGCF